MNHYDIPLTVAIFAMVTGVLTWAAIVSLGAYQLLTYLETFIERMDGRVRRRRALKIYHRAD